jgi:hypothetical protein
VTEEFILRQIYNSDNTTKLSLGNPSYTPLKIFLQKSAFDFHQYDIAKTYVLVSRDLSSNRVWGYGFILLNIHSNHTEEHPLMFFDLYKANQIQPMKTIPTTHNELIGNE